MSITISEASAPAMMPLDRFIRNQRRAYLIQVLKMSGGDQCKAAELAGVHRNTIWRYLKDAEISKKDIRLIKISLKNGAQPNV